VSDFQVSSSFGVSIQANIKNVAEVMEVTDVVGGNQQRPSVSFDRGAVVAQQRESKPDDSPGAIGCGFHRHHACATGGAEWL
jgi:type IV pilus biogenesis protein CpaD/CtpE